AEHLGDLRVGVSANVVADERLPIDPGHCAKAGKDLIVYLARAESVLRPRVRSEPQNVLVFAEVPHRGWAPVVFHLGPTSSRSPAKTACENAPVGGLSAGERTSLTRPPHVRRPARAVPGRHEQQGSGPEGPLPHPRSSASLSQRPSRRHTRQATWP